MLRAVNNHGNLNVVFVKRLIIFFILCYQLSLLKLCESVCWLHFCNNEIFRIEIVRGPESWSLNGSHERLRNRKKLLDA